MNAFKPSLQSSLVNCHRIFKSRPAKFSRMPGITLPFIKKQEGKPAQPTAGGDREPEKGHECEDCEPYKRKAALYKKIINRYKETIEASEDKSITELRTLIVPDNPVVAKIAEQVKSFFHPYIYDRDFLKAAEKAFSYCRDEIRNEPLPLEFWLTPEDIIELRAADEIDKAIFLCSLLIALENQSAKVVVETQERMRHAFVTFEFQGEFHLMDPTHGVNTRGEREEVIRRQIRQREKKVIYEFNNTEYNEW